MCSWLSWVTSGAVGGKIEEGIRRDCHVKRLQMKVREETGPCWVTDISLQRILRGSEGVSIRLKLTSVKAFNCDPGRGFQGVDESQAQRQ